MSLKKLLKKRRQPTEHELMVQKWFADGGDVKLRYDYDLDERSVVLDLGGYEGQWASDLFARYRCPIHIFEPVQSFADKIRERFRKNDALQVYTCGLGGSTRDEEIHLSADGSSVFIDAGTVEKISIVDVKTWMDEHIPEGRVNLVKINIEGGEYEFLDRLIETGLVERFDDIQVQFHNFAPDAQARMDKIHAALKLTHEPTYQYKFVWDNWRRKR